jgi:hypothetical protein
MARSTCFPVERFRENLWALFYAHSPGFYGADEYAADPNVCTSHRIKMYYTAELNSNQEILFFLNSSAMIRMLPSCIKTEVRMGT